MVNLEVTQCSGENNVYCAKDFMLSSLLFMGVCTSSLFILLYYTLHLCMSTTAQTDVYKTNKSVDRWSINQLSGLPKTVQWSVWMNTSFSFPQLQGSQQTEYQLDIQFIAFYYLTPCLNENHFIHNTQWTSNTLSCTYNTNNLNSIPDNCEYAVVLQYILANALMVSWQCFTM